MPARPSLDNGYLWVCNAAMSSSRARRIDLGLGELRCILRVRDFTGARDAQGRGFPVHAATTVELWVHPDDDQAAQSILNQAMAEP
ncbi:hypothetical protein [Tautonia plasticadhaerens]|uniref:Uncharacterized protein n=1 Tax=Tautonia plasticadhaerens TaxID=2527974 RepID=A0A518HAG4_9BACT|nr:hypothetical protein [Tautonia plasticadhaerens]QDV37844.1 hypothetical protein ElP_57910 [Tautonia plasticadhaerens]